MYKLKRCFRFLKVKFSHENSRISNSNIFWKIKMQTRIMIVLIQIFLKYSKLKAVCIMKTNCVELRFVQTQNVEKQALRIYRPARWLLFFLSNFKLYLNRGKCGGDEEAQSSTTQHKSIYHCKKHGQIYCLLRSKLPTQWKNQPLNL